MTYLLLKQKNLGTPSWSNTTWPVFPKRIWVTPWFAKLSNSPRFNLRMKKRRGWNSRADFKLTHHRNTVGKPIFFNNLRPHDLGTSFHPARAGTTAHCSSPSLSHPASSGRSNPQFLQPPPPCISPAMEDHRKGSQSSIQTGSLPIGPFDSPH